MRPMTEAELDAYFEGLRAERDDALISLDEKKLVAYFQKYEIPLPDNLDDFWAGIYIARAHAETLPAAVRKESEAWLDERYTRWREGKGDRREGAPPSRPPMYDAEQRPLRSAHASIDSEGNVSISLPTRKP